mmetsp:Transcript_14877/g.23149  ORF Transcript_14877/g.23149 Transcript_14877/m.23149 type:complete len:294 (-) Transcript_14877:102-983(-)
MGTVMSKEVGAEASGQEKLGLLLAYSALVAVNVLSSMGTFGPDNAQVSGNWPTLITPKGYAFAIWGPIFMTQGIACIWGALTQDASMNKAIGAVLPAWLAMWSSECAWQFVFVNAPMTADPPISDRLAIFVPSAFLLVSGYLSGLWACQRLKNARLEGFGPGLVKLSSAVNTGWLSAASCIGIELVREAAAGGIEKASVPPAVALAGGAAVGALASLAHFRGGWIGLGYAGAVAWALQAVKVGPASPSDVKTGSEVGVAVVLAAMGIATVASFFFKKPSQADQNDGQSLLDRK